MGSVISEVIVPIAYDLGGASDDVDGLRTGTGDLVSDLTIDRPALRAFNLAYLSTHPPILSGRLEPRTASLGGTEWSIGRGVRIYPRFGIVLHTLRFTAPTPLPVSSAAAFYEAFLDWEHRDYFHYLDRMGAMSDIMAVRTGFRRADPSHGTLSSPAEDLRLALCGIVNPRAAIYPFQDFRVLFVVEGEGRNLHATLRDAFGPLGLASDRNDDAWFTSASLDLLSSATVSVALIHGSTGPLDLNAAVSLFGLAHVQWYLCQIWIHNANFFRDASGHDRRAEATVELAEAQYQLGRDLTEVGNPHVMLNDAVSIRLAQYLMDRLGLAEQRRSVTERLEILSRYFSEAVAYQASRDAQRLQILFSFSAATGIAALLPALVQADIAIRAATASLAIACWLAFAINVSGLVRRAQSRRRPRAGVLGKERKRRSNELADLARHSIESRTP